MPPVPKRSKPVKADGLKKAATRVPRACDNCRLRKSKCDGLVPCSFCRQHNSECTYDESRPKKQLDTKYIVTLERTIDRLKGIIGIPSDTEVTSDLLDNYENPSASRSNAPGASSPHSSPSVARRTSHLEALQDASPTARTLLETMVEATGQLNIDEDGKYDYSGNNSGLLLVEKIRDECDQLLNHQHGGSQRATQFQRSPLGTPYRTLSQAGLQSRTLTNLPAWEVAANYVNTAFTEAFALFNFMHRPSFELQLHDFYSARSTDIELTREDTRFDTLLNALFALGELFGAANHVVRSDSGGQTTRSEVYFDSAQRSLDLADCRDILSLQTLICLILYMQGSGQIPTCYTYLSLAMTAAVRMGLHRADSLSSLNPLEREIRKRIFWTLRAMDSYITTILDLPRTLNDEDTDQAYPLELEDESISPQSITLPKSHTTCPMSTVNAHTRLSLVLIMVKNITSGSDGGEQKQNNRYQVDYSRIVEAEKDLMEWSSRLPSYNKAPDPVPPETVRAQILLRIAHGHVQMVLYRPFLHHIARKNADLDFDYRAFACASACIKAAMQVVWLVQALDNADLLNGPSWLLFFTLFMAVVVLTLFVVTNKDDPTTHEYYLAAQRGFLVFERFADHNELARTYAENLRPLFRRSTIPGTSSDNNSQSSMQAPNNANMVPVPPDMTYKSSGKLHRYHNPSSAIFSSDSLQDLTGLSAPEPSAGPNLQAHSIPLPSPTFPSVEDPIAQHVYLQAMNHTPTNLFEGFSSETAMMDYFSWHEQEPGPTTGDFGF